MKGCQTPLLLILVISFFLVSCESEDNSSLVTYKSSEMGFTSPPFLRQSRAVDPNFLFAEVQITYSTATNAETVSLSNIAFQDGSSNRWMVSLDVPTNTEFVLDIIWYDTMDERRLNLATLTRTLTTGSYSTSFELIYNFDDYDSARYNEDGDSFTNLAERENGTSPFDQFDPENTAIEINSTSLDSDNDGVPDVRDQFPFDPSETSDLNGDGLGDNANPFEGTVITGKVINDMTSTPVANAKISLELVNSNSETNPVVLTATDSQGDFSLLAETTLIPDSFILVVSANGYRPAAVPLDNVGTEIVAPEIILVLDSEEFVIIESQPSVHHLGDDSFGGSENSQFQRTSEGPSLVRTFNLSNNQVNQNVLNLNWVAKGIQGPNVISINGNVVATTDETNPDGSFTEQSVSLQVSGILIEGANSILIESALTGSNNSDIDDFEFVFIGISGFN